MPSHLIKTAAQIEEEIRRRAQGAADAANSGIMIVRPKITASDEPTIYGSHWIIEEISGPGLRHIERAVVQIAHIWDIPTE